MKSCGELEADDKNCSFKFLPLLRAPIPSSQDLKKGDFSTRLSSVLSYSTPD
jgi:hypothetical protein